jgi:hypothetical protein
MESKYSATVVGLHYYHGAESLSIGDGVLMRCQPKNRYDSNAVVVLRADGSVIGHIKAQQAAIIAPILNQQHGEVKATIRSIQRTKPTRCDVTFKLPLPLSIAAPVTHHRPSPAKPKACFVATEVFQSADHPVVDSLRRWRDQVLARSSAGRVFIVLYTIVGPRLAAAVARFPSSRPILRWALGLLANVLALFLKDPFVKGFKIGVSTTMKENLFSPDPP